MNSEQPRWDRKTAKASQLLLDPQNPRLTKEVRDEGNEEIIFRHLLDKESVMKIAESIAHGGYHQSSISIVIDSGGGKYTVMDGNRRLAACQILTDPSLTSDSRLRKKASRLSGDLPNNALNEIPIVVAPSREAARREIWAIHVAKLAKLWQVLEQLRMYRNLIDSGISTTDNAAREYGLTEVKFKRELAKLYFYERIIDEVSPEEEEGVLKSIFNKIDRVILSRNGQKLLGYKMKDVDNNGTVHFDSDDEANAKLTKLIPYIADPGKIHPQINQSDLEELVYSRIDPILFPPKKSRFKKKKTKTPIDQPDPPGGPAKSEWITASEYRDFQGADRVKDLLKELRSNEPERGKNLNMVAISLRVLVELAVYDALSRSGSISRIIHDERAAIKAKNTKRVKGGKPIIDMAKNWTPSLKEMLSYITKESSGLVADPQKRDTLNRLLEKHKEFVDDASRFIHNVSYRPAATQVKEMWDSFCRPIMDVLREIKPQK